MDGQRDEKDTEFDTNNIDDLISIHVYDVIIIDETIVVWRNI